MVETSATESMYIAASTRKLADRLIERRGRSGFSIFAASELTPKHRIALSDSQILLIDSEGTLTEFVEQPARFSYEKHAVRYE